MAYSRPAWRDSAEAIEHGITSSVAALNGNYVNAVADNALLSAPFGAAQGGPLIAASTSS